jgi:hypothetical protein
MLRACCWSSAHSIEKPLASIIFPRKAMTKLTLAFADLVVAHSSIIESPLAIFP